MNRPGANLRTKSGQPLYPVGIGTWGYGQYPLTAPGTAAEVAAVRHSLLRGQNFIDTAEQYARGGAELVVGQAIQTVPRQDVFIASKLWKDHVAHGQVRPAVAAVLRRLGCDYLDMLSIHAPWFDAPWQQAVPQIDELIDEGLVRHFGVSNFNAERLREVLALTRHGVAADQLHFSYAHRQEVTPELSELCAANGITPVAYLPLEKGSVLQLPAIQTAAARHQATPSQVALAWLVSQGTLPVPRALKREHIDQNAAAAGLKLNAEDYAGDLS